MNFIFTVIVLLSAVTLLISSPDRFLTAALDGTLTAAKTALTLFCIYAVWMGLSEVCERAGLSRAGAKLLSPVTKKVFKTENERANECLAMNISCNLLGLGGAATPYAVKAIGELERDKNDFAQKLLFVINATSVQLIPTTVIALRAAAGSVKPSDIILPSLIATAVSTVSAVLLYFAGTKLWRR